ncbi:hypothetical protein VM1G_10527 [Cytospora mali]|uniref:Uncharacterized protein n=1 Tax=Cytospora mali TaxID=578113 RepID=A0A194VIL1_CYTMA|nr:hypothetical protein VM1G_10527 [Valsa mali]
MSPRKQNGQCDSHSDTDWSAALYKPSDASGNEVAVSAPTSPASFLRNHSQLILLQRYRTDDSIANPTHSSQAHSPPVFNQKFADLTPSKTLSPDHTGPPPSEMAHERPFDERKLNKNNVAENYLDNENNLTNETNFGSGHNFSKAIDRDDEDDVSFQPTKQNGEFSWGPAIAHLRRKSPKQDPLKDVYTPNSVFFDHTKFHIASDQYFPSDEHSTEVALDDFDEDTNDEQHNFERCKAAYVDWASLSDGVKWAVLYDLTQDMGFTAATRALCLSTDEIISFRKLYRDEKANWYAFHTRMEGEIQDALNRQPNESTRPFPRADFNATPAPAFHLVTDSLGKAEVVQGRRFLKFLGLDQYANIFNKWYGSGSKFHAMPEVLDLNLDFLEQTHYRYSGFDINFQSGVKLEAQDQENDQHLPMTHPLSPGMPNSMDGVHWPPIANANCNPYAMDSARQAFKPATKDKDLHNTQSVRPPPAGYPPLPDWNGPGLGLNLMVFDPAERARAEVNELFRHSMNPNGVIINGNEDELIGTGIENAGYRWATRADLNQGPEGNLKFMFATDPNDPDDFLPYDVSEELCNAEDFPQELSEEVTDKDFLLYEYVSDPPVGYNGPCGNADDQGVNRAW